MSDTPFPYSEKLLAEKLSIPRAEVREARGVHLDRGVDWEKDAGGAVMLSGVGVGRLINLFDVAPGTVDLDALEKNGAPVAVSDELIIVAICPNPKMVLANDTGDPNEERSLVDVGCNRNFAIGDVLKVAEHEVQPGVLQLVSKLPSTTRRPQTNESLRDPSADWGRVEAERIREKGAAFRRTRAAIKK